MGRPQTVFYTADADYFLGINLFFKWKNKNPLLFICKSFEKKETFFEVMTKGFDS